jgi:hypothetical protein
MRRGIAIGLTAVAVAAGGCGGQGGQPSPLPNGELVSLSRTGSGPFDHVSIIVRPDRHVVVTSHAGSQVTRVGPASFAALRRDLDGVPFAKLAAQANRQLPPAPGAYRYVIAYRGRLAHWEQGSVPSSLKPTVSELSSFFASAPAGNTPLVRLRRAGGPAGSRFSLVVDYDGHASRREEAPTARSRSYRIAPATLERLKSAVVEVELAEVPSSSGSAPAGGGQYEVSTNRRTIRAPEGNVPPLLRRVIALAEGRAYTAGG